MKDNRLLVAQIRQIQSAENEAQRRDIFNELVHHYQAMAYGYAYAMMGDRQLAEDATQEGFLTAYLLLDQLREAQAFPLWLQRILHTHCCRLLKEQRRLPQSLELSAELSAEQFSPHAMLERVELRKVIYASIASLPESQQAPVALYYLDDYSQREIAQTLNLSLAAVKKRLERARVHLEERMRAMAQDYLQSAAQGSAATSDETGNATMDLFAALMESAAAEGQYVLLETLLVEGMGVDEQDEKGQTVLHWAARAGHLEAVELLLAYHADATLQDKRGQTPLQLAVEGRHSAVAKRLRQAVGSPTRIDN